MLPHRRRITAEGGSEETRSMGEREAASTGEPLAGEREEGQDGATDGTGRVGDGMRGSEMSSEKVRVGPDTAEEVTVG